MAREVPGNAPNVVESIFRLLRSVATLVLLKVAPPETVVPAFVWYCPVLEAENSTVPLMTQGQTQPPAEANTRSRRSRYHR
jgi:hypothetical protein